MTQTSTHQAPAETTARFSIPAKHPMVSVLGSGDSLLRVIEAAFPDTDIHVRGNEVSAVGEAEDVALIQRLFDELVLVLRTGQPLTEDAVERSIAMLRRTERGEGGAQETPAQVLTQNILSSRGRTIRPKTLNQKRYVDAIDQYTVVFGIGPAGTGKTYLAMAKAVQALQSKQVNRIILTRPAVEAGERLGFLPGTLYEKIDPYLRPLYDALHDMLDPDSIPRLMAAGTIEVAPLAYMRGRAQPLFTEVLTPDGWRTMGDLRVGDLVIGSNGQPTPVLGVYPQGPRDIYRVTAQDGSWTLCCDEHLWTVRTAADRRQDGPWRVLQTRDMIGDLRAGHTRRYELPMLTAPVSYPERDVPQDPYALGLLLGDGRLCGSTASADPDRAAVPEAAVAGVGAGHRSGSGQAVDHLGAPGDLLTQAPAVTARAPERAPVDGRPHRAGVPEAYLYNASGVRLAVLQGILDSAGGPVPQEDHTCLVRYTTTSTPLRDDVVALVRSLGGVAYARGGAAGRPAPGAAVADHRDATHVLDIRLPEGVEPFRLGRKRDAYHAAGGAGCPTRFIDSIEPAGREEAVCIQVAAEDSLYVTRDYLLTHNTLNDAFIILDEAQNTNPEQMKMFLTRLGFDSKIVITGDVTQIDLPGGTKSGLRQVQGILEGVDDVHFSRLTSTDVVRHKLVSRIVDAYDRFDSLHGTAQGGQGT